MKMVLVLMVWQVIMVVWGDIIWLCHRLVVVSHHYVPTSSCHHIASSCHVIISIFRCHPRFVRRRRCLFARSKRSICQKRLCSTFHDHCQHNHPHSPVSVSHRYLDEICSSTFYNPIHHNHIVPKLILNLLMKIHRRFAQKCQRMFAKKGSRKNAGQPNATTV